MFKAIKEFFTGKKAPVAAEPVAPYKVEAPVAAEPVVQAKGNVPLGGNTVSVAPAAEPAKKSVKKSGSPKPRPAGKKPAAKKPAAKKPTPTP